MTTWDDNSAVQKMIAEAGRTVRAAIRGWPETIRLCILLAVTAAAAALLLLSSRLITQTQRTLPDGYPSLRFACS